MASWVTILPWVGAVLIIVGILSYFKFGARLKGFTSWPFGPKLGGIAWIVVGLLIGGIAGLILFWASLSGAVSGVAPGTIIGEKAVVTPGIMSCQFSTIAATVAATIANTTLRADPYDTSHYYIDIKNTTNAGAASFNGTLLCQRTGDIEKSFSDSCYFKAGSYTSKTSSTDVSQYYMVALASGASRISGIPAGFKQTAYLNDGAIATTSSNQEKTDIVFTGGSSAQAQETVGFYFTLPGTTNMNYLNDQDSVDNVIICAKSGQVARITVNKLAGSIY